jgi:hypothetical protein
VLEVRGCGQARCLSGPSSGSVGVTVCGAESVLVTELRWAIGQAFGPWMRAACTAIPLASGNRPAQTPSSPDLKRAEQGTATVWATSWSYRLGGYCEALFSTAVLGLAATALSIPPAIAAPPEPVIPVPGGVTLTECGFDVQATRSGKIKFLEQAQGLKVLFPNQRVTLTNPDTDESVTLVISGQLRVTPTDTGEILRFTGHNVVVGPEIGILYTTGNQTFVVDADGTTTLTESQGDVVDVCEVLAP